MSWPFETSEPFVTPEYAAEHNRRRKGLSPEEWALPPTLVATFQRTAYARLLERAGLDPEHPEYQGRGGYPSAKRLARAAGRPSSSRR